MACLVDTQRTPPQDLRRRSRSVSPVSSRAQSQAALRPLAYRESPGSGAPRLSCSRPTLPRVPLLPVAPGRQVEVSSSRPDEGATVGTGYGTCEQPFVRFCSRSQESHRSPARWAPPLPAADSGPGHRKSRIECTFRRPSCPRSRRPASRPSISTRQRIWPARKSLSALGP